MHAPSVEQAGPDLARMVKHAANFHHAGRHGVIDEVRLKTETPQALAQVVSRLIDGRKVRQQTKGAYQTGRVGIRLICAELAFRVVVDLRELVACADRDPVASHGGAPQLASALPL